MQLLVSVRSANEARAALAGGAAIIDAKDPEAGALGAVSPEVLAEISRAVPNDVPLSAAGGDPASDQEVRESLGRIEVPLAFVKLGFRGIGDPVQVEPLLALAVKLAEDLPGPPRVVAVAYADWRRSRSCDPTLFPQILASASAHGLLIDTAIKDGKRLFDFLSVGELLDIGRSLRDGGMGFAVAGSLTALDLADAVATGADILGVRGAVSLGGRNGRVDSLKVTDLAQRLGRALVSGAPAPALHPVARSPR